MKYKRFLILKKKKYETLQYYDRNINKKYFILIKREGHWERERERERRREREKCINVWLLVSDFCYIKHRV